MDLIRVLGACCLSEMRLSDICRFCPESWSRDKSSFADLPWCLMSPFRLLVASARTVSEMGLPLGQILTSCSLSSLIGFSAMGFLFIFLVWPI